MKARRLAALLAVPAFVLLSPRPVLADSSSDGSSSAFDAYLAGGDASCLELTVSTGYSFIVEPDARLPRATSAIEEGSSGALAAPADPGDSVDALAGLFVPREEGQIPWNQFPQGSGTKLQQVLNPVNPHLEYAYEHASAQWPNGTQQSDQEATYLGAPNAAFSDPSGLVSVDGTTADAKAGAAYATATAGSGAAASLPMLGLSVGRLSGVSHSAVTASSVVDQATCTLQDVTIAPPGSGVTLHIGTLAAALTTQRDLSAGGATSSHTLQVADVTLNGKDILPAGKGALPIPAQTFTLPPPPSVPGVPAPAAWIKSIAVTGTTSSDKRAANNNEATSALTAATIVITTTAPVPSSIPPQPGQNPISTTPAVYTLQLASLDSQAYGLPATDESLTGGGATVTGGVSGLAGSAYSSGGSSLSGGGGAYSSTPGTPGTPGTPATKPVASAVLIPGSPGSIRWGVVGIAALMEALLLGSLATRRRFLRLRPSDPAPTSFLDLP